MTLSQTANSTFISPSSQPSSFHCLSCSAPYVTFHSIFSMTHYPTSFSILCHSFHGDGFNIRFWFLGLTSIQRGEKKRTAHLSRRRGLKALKLPLSSSAFCQSFARIKLYQNEITFTDPHVCSLSSKRKAPRAIIPPIKPSCMQWGSPCSSSTSSTPTQSLCRTKPPNSSFSRPVPRPIVLCIIPMVFQWLAFCSIAG